MTDPRFAAAQMRARRDKARDDSLAWAVSQIRDLSQTRQGSPEQFGHRDSNFSSLRCPKAAKLQASQGNVTLPVAATSAGAGTIVVQPAFGDFVDVVRTEAGMAWERQIHLWSRRNNSETATPVNGIFDATIEWTSGGGMSGKLEVTASGGAVTVYLKCITLIVRVANWDSRATNEVLCTVEDGYATQTQDLHKTFLSPNIAAGGVQPVLIPPYARYATVMTQLPGDRALMLVELLDAQNNVMAAVSAAAFNQIALGAATNLQLRNGNGLAVAATTVDFTLGWN